MSISVSVTSKHSKSCTWPHGRRHVRARAPPCMFSQAFSVYLCMPRHISYVSRILSRKLSFYINLHGHMDDVTGVHAHPPTCFSQASSVYVCMHRHISYVSRILSRKLLFNINSHCHTDDVTCVCAHTPLCFLQVLSVYTFIDMYMYACKDMYMYACIDIYHVDLCLCHKQAL